MASYEERRSDRPAPLEGTARKIADAAGERFAAKGYDGTSMREIAAVVGITPASLYNHFPSKEEILWRIVAETTLELEGLQMTMADGDSPSAKLRWFVENHVEFHAKNCGRAKITNIYLYNLDDHHFDAVVDLRRGYQCRLQQILREGAERGDFHPQDILPVSFAVLQMGIGVAYWYRPDGHISPGALATLYADMTMRMLSPFGSSQRTSV